jgi:hypothetical protein
MYVRDRGVRFWGLGFRGGRVSGFCHAERSRSIRFQVSEIQVSTVKLKSQITNFTLSEAEGHKSKLSLFFYRLSSFRLLTFYQQNKQIEKLNQ